MASYNENLLPTTTGFDLGSSSQRWDGFFQDVNIAGSLTIGGATVGQVFDASTYTGADFSVKVKACIADAIAAGGGIVYATGLTGAQTISQEIAVGNSAGVPIVLILAAKLTATCTINNSAQSAFTVYDKSSLIGYGTGGSSQVLIKANASTNVDSLVRTDPTPSGGGSYVRIEGIEPWNASSASGTFANGMVHIQHCFDDSVISRVFARADGVRGWYIHDVCCGTTFYNCGANGFGTAGSEPCVIGKNGEHTNAVFIGFSPVHPGDTKNAILINDVGTSYTALDFYGTYTECNSTDTVTPLIQINGGTNGTVNFNGVNIAGTSPAGGSTAYLIDIGAGTKGVTLNNIRRGGLSNTINDNVNSRTVTDSFVPHYSFGNSSSINSLKLGASSALTGVTGSGASVVTNVSPTLTTSMAISGAAATNRAINLNTSGVARFIIRANSTAEGGANAGSDWELSARDDTGALLSTPILVTRSTGNIAFSGKGTFSGGIVSAAATPTVAASQLGLGSTVGFGTGAAGTAVTTTTKGGGTGPTTPQTVVNYLKVNIGGTDFYVPLVQ